MGRPLAGGAPMSETLLGMVLLAATRNCVRMLAPGDPLRSAWHGLYGYIVWRCDWPDGLWVSKEWWVRQGDCG